MSYPEKVTFVFSCAWAMWKKIQQHYISVTLITVRCFCDSFFLTMVHLSVHLWKVRSAPEWERGNVENKTPVSLLLLPFSAASFMRRCKIRKLHNKRQRWNCLSPVLSVWVRMWVCGIIYLSKQQTMTITDYDQLFNLDSGLHQQSCVRLKCYECNLSQCLYPNKWNQICIRFVGSINLFGFEKSSASTPGPFMNSWTLSKKSRRNMVMTNIDDIDK